MKYASAAFALGGLCLAVSAALADPLPRPSPAAGSVIARKSGEEVRFVDISGWRYVDLQQDLLSGDVLRTNATGQLAVLFSDRTQIRLGRNTSLLVKRMGGGGDTGLELQSGTIWARAERGGQGVVIDTPAAAAAIRGTDWTMTVGADGKTSLIVLEGLVELSNAYGSVKVAQGEGAVAAIGSAPSKIVVVNSKDREQMLYNLSLREAFNLLPVSTLSGADMRRERQRISAAAPEDRSAEDWLTLAEVQLIIDGRQAASASLAKARSYRLSGAQKARANLVDAFIAGGNNQYSDAAQLFEKAITKLDPKRRSIAEYGRYYARSLNDPKLVEKPPTRAVGPYAAVAEAYTAAFLQDIPTAVALLKKAEAKYPDNALIPAARARIVLLLDDREQVREAAERSLAIDPEQAIALDARANYRSSINGDNEGALADLKAALASEPGNDMIWNSLGLVQANRDAVREAEKAFLQAVALDPQDPLGHVNLALLYLQELRIKEAKQQIDLARKVDPNFDLTFMAQGSYDIHTGQMDKAVINLLTGAVSNPGYAQGQLLLAVALYEQGDRQAVEQALDNADRLDPNDPLISSVRTAIAIDEYDADSAIRNAQEYLKRSRAAGGEYAALSASQEAGSVLNDAFRLQGLDAWGQYYGDAVFDPFTGSSYIDQAVRGSINPFVNTYSYDTTPIINSQNNQSFSAFIQGLLIEPHMLASRERTANLLQMPFFEAALGGGVIADEENTGWISEAEIRGLTLSPYPISIYGNLEWTEPKDSIDIGNGLSFERDMKIVGGNGYLSQSPTPDDRVVAYVNYASSDNLTDVAGLPFGATLAYDEGLDASQSIAGLAWSHTFGYRNVANAALFYTDQSTTFKTDAFGIVEVPAGSGFFALGREVNVDDRSQKSYMVALNHTVGNGDLTWRYGLEGGFARAKADTGAALYLPDLLGDVPYQEAYASETEDAKLALAYVDLLYDITPDLKVEGALFGRYINGDSTDTARLEPRIGIAWAPADGHWLRAGFTRQGDDFDTATLSPIGIVGLQPNQGNVAATGYTDTFALRWDAEWSDRVFTAVDYQHQELNDLSITLPLSNTGITVSDGRIDRVALTANIALGNGFGLSATGAYIDSENQDPAAAPIGGPIPFIPDKTGQVALTWVNTANIKATLAANYVGERIGPGIGLPADDFWTLDAALTWEPFDKRAEIELSAFNLLDEDFELAPGVPGWGPTFKGTVKVRF